MSFSPTIKDPASVAHLRFEYGQPGGVAITAIDAVSIAPAGRVAEVAPLLVSASHAGSTYALVSVAGGTNGELYLIECLVEDAAGDSYEQRRELLCVDLSFRVPGAALPTYVDIASFVARAGLDLTIQLTDEHGTGAIDAERLERALLDAQATVDSYLSGRYATPLALPAPAPIPTITYDLAIARLYAGEMPAGTAQRQRDAMRQLADLRDGKQLITAPVLPTQNQPSPLLVRPGTPIFTRETLKGF